MKPPATPVTTSAADEQAHSIAESQGRRGEVECPGSVMAGVAERHDSAGFVLAALFTEDPKVERLADQFGTSGPLVMVVLLGKARVQARRGRVEWTYRALSRAAFLEGREQAAEIVAAMAEVGIVELEAADEWGFTARFTRWRRWQSRLRSDSERAETDENGSERNETDENGWRREEPEGFPPDPPSHQQQLLGIDVAVQGNTNNNRTTKGSSRKVAGTRDYVGPPAPQFVLAALKAVAATKPNPKPLKPEAVAKACADYCDRDLEREAERFEHYWIDGAGENRGMRDVPAAWRNWLKNSPRADRAAGQRTTRLRAKLDDLHQLAADLESEESMA